MGGIRRPKVGDVVNKILKSKSYNFYISLRYKDFSNRMDSYREQLEKSLGMSMAGESDANTSISSATGMFATSS